MGELEPDDSRIITQNPSSTPLEPERTGPREGETRQRKDDADAPKPSEEEAKRWQVKDQSGKG